MSISGQTFGPFPTALQNAIQQNFLEREFIDPLLPLLAYREIAERVEFPGRIGDTITQTKVGLMTPNTTPLNPSTNTNLDNGLTPQQYSDEQYVLQIFQYPQVAPDINLLDDETTIAAFAMRNAYNLGIAQATCLDRIAQQPLFNAYMGGNTFLTATATSATQHVDDIRGFQTVVVNGNVVPVSVSNPLPVFVNGVLFSLTSATADSVNISTALVTGGISGTLVFSASVTGTAAQAVIGQYAPLMVRPNGRATTAAITSSDLMNMTSVLNSVAYLRNNAVPKVRGSYNMYINSTSMNQLFQDTEFQQLTRGNSTRDPVYQDAWVYDAFLDVRWIMSTETFVQVPGNVDGSVTVTQGIQRPIICGDECLVEGVFDRGLEAIRNMASRGGGVGQSEAFMGVDNILGERFVYDGFYMYLRRPLDRLGQIISQTSNFVGGYTVPTDVTTNSNVVRTASSAYYKRAVVIEHSS